ncbi:hypothetical protein [Halomonas cupida]|nr:hypothetical protein [Halomonas cupida]
MFQFKATEFSGSTDYIAPRHLTDYDSTEYSEECYNKLRRAVVHKKVSLDSTGEQHIDLLSFDWSLSNSKEAWWSNIQELPFLHWYVDSFHLQSDSEKERWYAFCYQVLERWQIQCAEKFSSGESKKTVISRAENIRSWHLIVSKELGLLESVEKNINTTYANTLTSGSLLNPPAKTTHSNNV